MHDSVVPSPFGPSDGAPHGYANRAGLWFARRLLCRAARPLLHGQGDSVPLRVEADI